MQSGTFARAWRSSTTWTNWWWWWSSFHGTHFLSKNDGRRRLVPSKEETDRQSVVDQGLVLMLPCHFFSMQPDIPGEELFSAIDLSSSTGSNYSVVEDVFLRLSKINRGETLLTHPYLLLLIHKQFHRAHCVCSSNISMNWISNRSLTRCPVQKTVSITEHPYITHWVSLGICLPLSCWPPRSCCCRLPLLGDGLFS